MKASLGEFTIGSPLTLKLVFTSTETPDIFLKSLSKFQYLGFVSFETVCILALKST